MQLQIGIDGMHCASCSANVEKSLKALGGVSSAHVNLALEEAQVEYDERKVKQEAIFKSITDLGFSIRDSVYRDEDEHIRMMHMASRRMIFSWILTALVLVLMIPHMFFGSKVFGHNADAWI
ncbi:MAG: cation transporter, partial [Candidatus Cloacimonetes bacterium]|nr:cation transporter [Candidatus Cloacimonadota bacterium]